NSSESPAPSVAPVPSDPQSLARAIGAEFAQSLAGRAFSAEFLAQVPIGYARDHGVIGLTNENGKLMLLALSSLAAWEQLDVLRRFLKRTIEPLFAPPDAITAAINQAYQQRSGQARELIQHLDRRDVLAELADLAGR